MKLRVLSAGLVCVLCFVIGGLAGDFYGAKQGYRISREGDVVTQERIASDLTTLLVGSDVQHLGVLWSVTKTNPPDVILTVDTSRRRDALASREQIAQETVVRVWLYLSVSRPAPSVTRVAARVVDMPYFIFLPFNQGAVGTELERRDFKALLSKTTQDDGGPSVENMAQSLQGGTGTAR